MVDLSLGPEWVWRTSGRLLFLDMSDKVHGTMLLQTQRLHIDLQQGMHRILDRIHHDSAPAEQ